MYRLAFLALFLLLASAGAAAAQEMIAAPPAIPSDDPRAQLVAALVKPILAGQRAEAEAYLRKHAADSYTPEQSKSGLDEIVARIDSAEYEIHAFRQGMGGVIAELRRKDASTPTLAVVAALAEGSPSRITGLQIIGIQIQGG